MELLAEFILVMFILAFVLALTMIIVYLIAVALDRNDENNTDFFSR